MKLRHLGLALLAGLAACGGGVTDTAPVESGREQPQAVVSPAAPSPNSQAAFRFLSQATFGPTPTSIADYLEQGQQHWLDRQMAAPWTPVARTAETWYQLRRVESADAKPERREVQSAILRAFFVGEAQLRWRVAYALSQILVVSMEEGAANGDPIGFASYFDTLAEHAFGNYRNLLEAVALHPAMGIFLSHKGNMPPKETTGRVPDENFAREILQLFSIGLYRLKNDGSPKLDASGNRVATYGPDDVTGLAHVFTGFAYDCRDGLQTSCFWRSVAAMPDAKAGTRPMVGYPQFHSTEEKRFLGATVRAQSNPDPKASLKVALDTIAAHPNVGPFLARQLIQRLVTSNPSPSYIRAVAAVFNNNGAGVRGDLRAVVRAILTHPEAASNGTSVARIREPILRLAAFARAFQVKSNSGEFRTWYEESDDTIALGQWPYRSPSVFNFYRPNFVPPNGELAAAGMVAPEMQIVGETEVSTYVRFMRNIIEQGFGMRDPLTHAADMRFNYATAVTLAADSGPLVDHVFSRLLGAGDYPLLRSDIITAVQSIPIPPKLSWNDKQIERAKVARVRAALLLTVASPEFIVQK